MAISMQASSSAPCSSVPRIHKISAAGGSDVLLRSPFLGSGRIHIACETRKTRVGVRNFAEKAGTIRSASFFEKLGQLFFSSEKDQEQVLPVFEINNGDRGSPVLLRLTTHKDDPVPTLGDLVPYTNKVFDAAGKIYLGLSAGLCTCIENSKGGKAGDRYEVTYTHYLDGYGHISAMGPYYTTSDSEMVITGGTGIFKGARGIVKLHSVVPPIRILYTYYVTGIEKLPSALTSPVVDLKVPEVSPAQQSPVKGST